MGHWTLKMAQLICGYGTSYTTNTSLGIDERKIGLGFLLLIGLITFTIFFVQLILNTEK